MIAERLCEGGLERSWCGGFVEVRHDSIDRPTLEPGAYDGPNQAGGKESECDAPDCEDREKG